METIGSLIARSMERAGDRVAVRAHGEVWTHRQVLACATRFANGLAGRGLRPGDHVALMVADRAESVAAYVGTLLGGFVAVHINDRWTAREVDAVLAEADAAAFFYTGHVAPVVADLHELAATGTVIAGGEPARGEHLTWTALLDAAGSARPQIERPSDAPALIGFTSGTTGTPKGVVHTQNSLLRTVLHMPTHFDLRPRSRCAMTGTLSFVAGIGGVILPHLYLGGEISFMAGLPVDEWFERMVVEGSEFTYVPTPLADAFVEQMGRRPEVLQTLRVAMHSGSKIPAGTVRRLVESTHGRFGTAYGMTETGSSVTRTEAADWRADCPAVDPYASSGRCANIMDLRIVDAAGNTLPPGETGEISVRADTQFVGYYKRPDLTAETIVDGRILTGDIGWIDDAGFLYVTDRKKDMIVSGGMNVYPAEVEAALADLPGLAEIAVFGIPDERWGETVVAVAVRDDPALDEAAIIAAARARIASYKKPTQVHFTSSLPRTASLKIDKPALRRTWLEQDS